MSSPDSLNSTDLNILFKVLSNVMSIEFDYATAGTALGYAARRPGNAAQKRFKAVVEKAGYVLEKDGRVSGGPKSRRDSTETTTMTKTTTKTATRKRATKKIKEDAQFFKKRKRMATKEASEDEAEDIEDDLEMPASKQPSHVSEHDTDGEDDDVI